MTINSITGMNSRKYIIERKESLPQLKMYLFGLENENYNQLADPHHFLNRNNKDNLSPLRVSSMWTEHRKIEDNIENRLTNLEKQYIINNVKTKFGNHWCSKNHFKCIIYLVNTNRRQFYRTHADNASNQIKFMDIGKAYKNYFQSEPHLVQDYFIKKAEKERKYFVSIEKPWWNNFETPKKSFPRWKTQQRLRKFYFDQLS